MHEGGGYRRPFRKACDDVRDLWGFFKFRRPDAYGDVLKEKL